MTQPDHHRHPALAALLSFLLPGLGQAYAGHLWLAVLLALPVLALVGIALVGFTVLGDEARNLLLSATFLSALLVLDVALMGWRLFAIWQVGFALPIPLLAPASVGGQVPLSRGRQLLRARQPASVAFVVVLLVVTVVMHAWAGVVVGRLNSALGDVFSGGGVAGAPDPGEPPDEGPLNQPQYSWDGTERINFLLLGVDSAPGREQELTDTILVVSVDPVAETAVMVSVPRDTGHLPLPDRRVYEEGRYPHKINELASEARRNADRWCPDLPDEADVGCGLRSLERSIGLYLGIPIHYYAQVDLQGFAQLIDAVGGLNLCLPGPMVDPEYAGPGLEGRGIELPAGCTHYDGGEALAYARIRRGWIELPDGTREQQDDFKRAERQQRVLLELRRELAAADVIFELPGILDAVAATVTTDFPRDQAGDLASLLPLVTGPDIDRVVLGLPDYVDPPVQPRVNYLLIPRREAIREEMASLFGEENLEGWYLASGEERPPGDGAGGG